MSATLAIGIDPGEATGQRIARWTAQYRTSPGLPDEYLGPDGRPREVWRRLLERLGGLTEAEIMARFVSAERHIRDAGISFRIAGDQREHPWPLGAMPLVIEAEEWRDLSAGLIQRAELMEAILADVYGPGDLVATGQLPAAIVAGNPEFLHPLHGVAPPGGHHLRLYAADLARGPDGRWQVLADRTQAPSGLGWALENRMVLARTFPDFFQDLQVERLPTFFQAFRNGLALGAERADPRICLLTSGPYSSTYVEQAALARYLGLMLVEGDDLVMRDGRLHVRTVSGLKRADALWRRIDADYLDPLELNPASRLGVPGVLDALRNGTLVMANMPGSGLVESAALAPYLDGLCRRLLGSPCACRIRGHGGAAIWRGSPMSRPISTGWSCVRPRRPRAGPGGTRCSPPRPWPPNAPPWSTPCATGRSTMWRRSPRRSRPCRAGSGARRGCTSCPARSWCVSSPPAPPPAGR